MIMIRRGEGGGGAPLFAPGSLVRHRRYGYRAVVVALDLECRASMSWYSANQSQPSRDQPWYHLLVHLGTHTTYAAESNLMADPSPEPILHPLVQTFFDGFHEGAYKRNGRAWPTE